MKTTQLTLLILSFVFGATLAQEAQSTDDLLAMDFMALMDLEVVSASKKAESLFDSPLSTTAITRDEIINSGATSIPEALRLSPGLIVREKTNGNYDVHIRGLDYIPPGSRIENSENSLSLVMIDNRIVYSYFQGGTFWESLPVDITDIERIEVIRGPSSALYGPNAVSGAINIITRKSESSKPTIHANVAGGTQGTKIFTTNAGMGFNDKLYVRLSGNYQYRERFTDQYYKQSNNTYYAFDSLEYLTNSFGQPIYDSANPVSSYYPNPEMALDRFGGNVFVDYIVNENVDFGLALGTQMSKSQSVFIESRMLMNQRESSSNYANFLANAYGFQGRVSYQAGNQHLIVGDPSFKYDFNHLDATLEYDLELKNLLLRPGISYQSALYNSDPYTDPINTGFFKGEKELSSTALSLRADYRLLENTRLIVAYRGDKYNVQDKFYHSYQFIATHKINEQHLLRGVLSRSYRGPFILDTYTDYMAGGRVHVKGNENLDLPLMNMVELGTRNKWGKVVSTDIEVFFNTMENYARTMIDMYDTIPINPFVEITVPSGSTYENTKLKSQQMGITANFLFNVSTKLNFRLWATYQQTELNDLMADTYKPDSLVNQSHEWTPSLYGGFSINYIPTEKLSINVNGYNYANQTFNKVYDDFLNSQNKYYKTDIASNTLLNARVGYKFYQENTVFVNARNLLQARQQFAFGEEIGTTLLIGLDIKF